MYDMPTPFGGLRAAEHVRVDRGGVTTETLVLDTHDLRILLAKVDSPEGGRGKDRRGLPTCVSRGLLSTPGPSGGRRPARAVALIGALGVVAAVILSQVHPGEAEGAGQPRAS